MLDPTALVALDVSQRLMAEQFSEGQLVSSPPRRDSAQRPVRARAARALRTIANVLEPTPERRTAS